MVFVVSWYSLCLFFFFFKQKTAYELRISDWSSDVCSSDLYVSHRPPTVHDNLGRSQRELRWVDDRMMAAQGIYLYHYSLLFPKQVQEKCDYYQHADWAQRHDAVLWATEVFATLPRPFRVPNVACPPSRLLRHAGGPPQ